MIGQLDLIYENSYGERINLNEYPYAIQGDGFFDYSWSYASVEIGREGNKITNFSKPVEDIQMTLLIRTDNPKKLDAALNKFFSIVEKDVLVKSPGKLITSDEQYLQCYIVSGENTMWRSGIKANMKTINVIAESPYWCKDVEINFRDKKQDIGDYQFLDYPYSYDFDYLIGNNNRIINNDGAILHTDFELTFYGICIDPSVVIAGNKYTVYTELKDRESLVINSKAGTITKYLVGGQTENLFAAREKESDIFQKIPKGKHLIEYDGQGEIDIVLFQERSEPVWTF